MEDEGACGRVTAPPPRPPTRGRVGARRYSHGEGRELVAGPPDLTTPVAPSAATDEPQYGGPL